MRNSNTKLPQNFQELAKHMKAHQAVPLTNIDGTAFVAIRLADETLLDQKLQCELKAALLNIEHDKDTYAIAFIQFRLNKEPKQTYTVFYNLNIDTQFQDCLNILAMKHYGLLLLTQEHHDFVKFKAEFQGNFDLQIIAAATRNRATNYSVESFLELSHYFYAYHKDDQTLWNYLESIAPLSKQCYAALRMEAEKS